MKFLLDENFPKAAHALLTDRGHEAMDIRGGSDEGAEDSVMFEMAQRCEAALLTTDKDFYHTVPHLFPSHHGAVVIAVRQPNRKSILTRLVWFLDHFPESALAGRAFLLKDRSFSVYPPLGD